MKHTVRAACGLAFATLIAAGCGGGGGDGEDPPPNGPYDVAAAWRNSQTTAHGYTVSGNVGGQTLRSPCRPRRRGRRPTRAPARARTAPT